MTDRLIIFDTTLRDGEQSPGASMTKDEKLRIARQLERLKVDVIEAGFAASSNGDFEAVKAIAQRCDALLVLGAPNSSNSMRLVEVALAAGCPEAFLVRRAAEIDWRRLAGVSQLGITAGASAPEVLVEEVIAAAKARFAVTLEEIAVTRETVEFKLPKALSTQA